MKTNIHNQINELYKQGINICSGCRYEHAASCGQSRVRFCKKQIRTFKNNENKK